MSVALSNRFQGKRLMSLRSPAPDVPGSPPVRVPQHARELGGGRVVREVLLLPRRLFVSRRREGVRFAQSPAGEEARGDQSGKPRHCAGQRAGSLRRTVPPLSPDKISPFLPYPWPSPIASPASALWPPTPGKSIPPLSSLPGVSGCKL